MMRRFYILALLIMMWPRLSHSIDYGEDLSSPELQLRAHELYTLIRCPTCQGQSIEASGSQTAYDLRQYIRQQLEQGHNDTDIIDNLRQQYGQTITFAPILNSQTAVLWGLPFVLILLGSVALIVRIKKQ